MRYQIIGTRKPRCMSLASKPLPVAVRFPVTAQLLLPISGSSSALYDCSAVSAVIGGTESSMPSLGFGACSEGLDSEGLISEGLGSDGIESEEAGSGNRGSGNTGSGNSGSGNKG